ncbi:MAG: hypothetical protein Q8L04_12605 [Ignavibacteria bacterium]|nr:hypothetical protein [Ignavibacteria bacterium]
MIPKSKFLRQSHEFWANVKLISQEIGYTDRKSSDIKIPTLEEIQATYSKLSLDPKRIIINKKLTKFGKLLTDYFDYRSRILSEFAQNNLMDRKEAQKLYSKLKKELAPKCPLPMNKQKGAKRKPAYYTCIVNMLIEKYSNGLECDYEPKKLTAFTKNKFPVYSLSRRIDGAFPRAINPIAIWEIKEYYHTTTFGSRVADAVYETLLDGYELNEFWSKSKVKVKHYLMIDDYFTWWTLGKSYLCRICDLLHMGFITEVFFGKEVVERIPIIIPEWIKQLEKSN